MNPLAQFRKNRRLRRLWRRWMSLRHRPYRNNASKQEVWR
jgi:hypothetical protein